MNKIDSKIASKVNRSLVLSLIYRHPRISRVELADRTGLERSAITYILNDLIRCGLVEECARGVAGARGGRRPILLRIREEAGTILALDIGLTHARGVVANLLGGILHREELELERGNSLIAIAARFLDGLKHTTPELFSKAAVLGISTPGVVDAEGGIMIHNRYHGWDSVPAAWELTSRFAIPVFLENDANAAAFGEYQAWQEKGEVHSLLYFLIRETLPGNDYVFGIGGAAVFNGLLWRGDGFSCGETAGKANDYFFSLLRPLARRRADLVTTSLEKLLQLAERGDEEAKTLLRQWARYFGSQLADIAGFLDVGAVIVAFHPSEGRERLLEYIRTEFSGHYVHVRHRLPPIFPQKLAHEASIHGLLRFAQERIFVTDSSSFSILLP